MNPKERIEGEAPADSQRMVTEYGARKDGSSRIWPLDGTEGTMLPGWSRLQRTVVYSPWVSAESPDGAS